MSLLTVQSYPVGNSETLSYGVMENRTLKHQKLGALWYVPGLGGTVMGAIPFLTPLLKRFPVIYGTDLRGFGLNAQQTVPFNAAQLLDDLEQFYQQVILPSAPQPLVLCGISLGGVLATLLAIKNRNRFKGIALLSPAYKPHPDCFSLWYKLRAISTMLCNGKTATIALPYTIREVTQNPEVLNAPEHVDNIPLCVPPQFLLSVEKLAEQAFNQIPSLLLPTYMVIPEQDRICCPVAMKQAFSRLSADPKNECDIRASWYHDVTLEAESQTVSDALQRWAITVSAS
jgi:alpha-beta hydrolase superfamily lysophospholipase